MAEAGEVRVNTFVERQIDSLASKIEERLNADAMAIIGPILYGAEAKLRDAIEKRSTRRAKLALLVDTDGGVIEVVERMVNVIRHHYNEVTMIVADRAMSAGTVFVMSGDGIMMDYFGCLGPIDPQVERDGKLVPALSYLVQFERLKERAAS